MERRRAVSPLRSNLPATDIPGFFAAVAEALALYINTDGTPTGVNPVLIHEFPRERVSKVDDPFDIITFRVLKSSMSPTMKDGSAPRSPSLREVRPHSEMANYNLVTYGWWETVQVEFSIWSRANLRADTTTAWFHTFMMKYAAIMDFFRARGVDKFRFVLRGDDDFHPDQGQELYRRRLVYEFRLEILDSLLDKTLESVNLNIGVTKPKYNIEQIDTIELGE